MIQAAWKEVGVEANLKSTDQPTLLDLSDAGNPTRKQPPAYLLGWALGSEPDSYSIWACDGTFNDISYCNQEVDDLLNQGRLELDQSKRAQSTPKSRRSWPRISPTSGSGSRTRSSA